VRILSCCIDCSPQNHFRWPCPKSFKSRLFPKTACTVLARLRLQLTRMCSNGADQARQNEVTMTTPENGQSKQISLHIEHSQDFSRCLTFTLPAASLCERSRRHATRTTTCDAVDTFPQPIALSSIVNRRFENWNLQAIRIRILLTIAGIQSTFTF
jgi:hypothetical protein